MPGFLNSLSRFGVDHPRCLHPLPLGVFIGHLHQMVRNHCGPFRQALELKVDKSLSQLVDVLTHVQFTVDSVPPLRQSPSRFYHDNHNHSCLYYYNL